MMKGIWRGMRPFAVLFDIASPAIEDVTKITDRAENPPTRDGMLEPFAGRGSIEPYRTRVFCHGHDEP
jgi:hypothetical protein